jgi:hypothetical protein
MDWVCPRHESIIKGIKSFRQVLTPIVVSDRIGGGIIGIRSVNVDHLRGMGYILRKEVALW